MAVGDDEWYLICTIACFLKTDRDGDYYAKEYVYSYDDAAKHIDPDHFIEGTFDPLSYATRQTINDCRLDETGWSSKYDAFTDEVKIVEAALSHIEAFGPTHIPFLIMQRVHDGFELPVRVKPRHGRR